MKKYNFHAHTYRCGHGDVTISDEEYVKEYIGQGFTHIAFTDHCPEKKVIDTREKTRMEYSQLDEYILSIQSLKEKYREKISILIGFEFEYLPGQEEALLELKNKSDIMVLGQHFIYENVSKLKIFKQDYFEDEELRRYAKYINSAMELGLPDIVAHPDIYMLGRSEFGSIEKEIAERICASAEKHKVPLEINLLQAYKSLFNSDYKVTYPCKDFWEIATNYNISVIYGIDTHFLEQIRYHDESIEKANSLVGKEIVKALSFYEL